MKTDFVDPRDAMWEVRDPRYRVNFWQRRPPAPGEPPEETGYSSTEMEVTGAADVTEVLDWARQTAREDQIYTIDVMVPRRGELGAVRVFGGLDPTEARFGER